jgi:lycopene cyclase domain-containing protein
MPEYFVILVIIFLTSFILHKLSGVRLYKSLKHILVVNGIALVLGIVWDHIALTRGHWVFGEQYLLGPKAGLMPVEEMIFILVMMYFALVIYKIAERKFP